MKTRCLIFGCAVLSTAQVYQSTLPVDHPSIRYFQEADNVVSRLDGSKITSLAALLERLHINPDSQALVFSKTSFQAAKISPKNPRAIYFNDDAAVGYVPGGAGIEVAAFDPRQGAVFYTFSNGEFKRSEACLRCHQGPATMGVPGMFVGSVFPNSAGQPSAQGAIITDHRTAFADRWGGWYVNAKRGEQKDRANSMALDPAEPEQLTGRQNLTTLAGLFDFSPYLRPVSDIVALMTFEHQTQMMNYFTRLGWESRMGHVEAADIEAALGYMLFVDEVPLIEPIEGVSTFTKTFPQRGPRDSKGRSLRDFDLQTRMFRYPLSFCVYHPAFDALPEDVRGRLYRRLWEVLSGANRSEKFARLSGEDRRAILEILRETKGGLPGYFK